MTAAEAHAALGRYLNGSGIAAEWDQHGVRGAARAALKKELEEVLLNEWVIVMPSSETRCFLGSSAAGVQGYGETAFMCVLRKANPDDGFHPPLPNGCPCGAT